MAIGQGRGTTRVLMIVENCGFLGDPRVRRQAEALYSAGHQVSVVCPMGNRWLWHERIDGIAVYRFPPLPAGISRLGYFLEYAYAMLAIAVFSLVVLLREGFEIIHVSNPPDTLVLTTILYKLMGKIIIYDQHDLCPELYRAKFATVTPLIYRFLLWQEGLSYRLADHVITTNESYKRTAIARGHITESKITVVRNGPGLRNLSVRNVDAELRGKSNNLIVYAGILGFQDGLDCLCRILYCLRHDLGRDDFCCVVMGDGDALPRIKALTQELHLEEQICFTGWIEDSERYLRCLNTADICVSPEPSNDYNTQSTFVKIMEYMAAGKPIVTFDLAETRFSARDSALYVGGNDEREFAVQLSRLMDNPVLRVELGQRGQDRIRKELAWEYSVPKLLSVYDDCVKARESISKGRGRQESQLGYETASPSIDAPKS